MVVNCDSVRVVRNADEDVRTSDGQLRARDAVVGDITSLDGELMLAIEDISGGPNEELIGATVIVEDSAMGFVETSIDEDGSPCDVVLLRMS